MFLIFSFEDTAFTLTRSHSGGREKMCSKICSKNALRTLLPEGEPFDVAEDT